MWHYEQIWNCLLTVAWPSINRYLNTHMIFHAHQVMLNVSIQFQVTTVVIVHFT